MNLALFFLNHFLCVNEDLLKEFTVDLGKRKQGEENFLMEVVVNLKLKAIECAWIKQQSCISKGLGNFMVNNGICKPARQVWRNPVSCFEDPVRDCRCPQGMFLLHSSFQTSLGKLPAFPDWTRSARN